MNKIRKNVIVIVSVLALAVVFGGCAKKVRQDPATATATPNPKITHAEGRFLETETPSAEGVVMAMAEDSIDLKIGEDTYHFLLSDNARNDLLIFNKEPNNPHIMTGTVILVEYEESEDSKIAQSIEIVESN